jgi:hypothetical protein
MSQMPWVTATDVYFSKIMADHIFLQNRDFTLSSFLRRSPASPPATRSAPSKCGGRQAPSAAAARRRAPIRRVAGAWPRANGRRSVLGAWQRPTGVLKPGGLRRCPSPDIRAPVPSSEGPQPSSASSLIWMLRAATEILKAEVSNLFPKLRLRFWNLWMCNLFSLIKMKRKKGASATVFEIFHITWCCKEEILPLFQLFVMNLF